MKSISSISRYGLRLVMVGLLLFGVFGIGLTLYSNYRIYYQQPIVKDSWSSKFRDELQSHSVDEVFALIQTGTIGPGFLPPVVNKKIVRIRGGKATLTWHEDKTRELYRELTPEELKEFRSFIKENSIDDLEPYQTPCTTRSCWEYAGDFEYLHFKRGYEKSVPIKDFQGRSDEVTPYRKLLDVFDRLAESGEFKARYYLADEIKGLEVLSVGRQLPIQAVCKSAQAIRVLVNSGNKEKPDWTWRDLNHGALGDKLEPQIACPLIDEMNSVLSTRYKETYKHPYPVASADGKWVVAVKPEKPKRVIITPRINRREREVIFPNMRSIASVTGVAVIFGRKEMMVRIERESSRFGESSNRVEYRLLDPATGASKIVNGNDTYRYSMVVTSTDDKWVVFIKHSEDPQRVVRISRASGREQEISSLNLSRFESVKQMAAVPGRNEIIVAIGGKSTTYDGSGAGFKHRLLSPATGASRTIDGDFRPLLSPTYINRGEEYGPLPWQPTGNPHEYWVGLMDASKEITEIGRYDTDKFVFVPEIKLPLSWGKECIGCPRRIAAWVDEAEAKIYLLYRGDLLRFPLK